MEIRSTTTSTTILEIPESEVERFASLLAGRLGRPIPAALSEPGLKFNDGRRWFPLSLLKLYGAKGPSSAAQVLHYFEEMGVRNTRGRRVTPQDLNKQNNKLEGAGLLTRSYTGECYIWHLTEEGRQAIERNMVPMPTPKRRGKRGKAA